jgi:UDP-glucose 4-epimerase
VRKALVTGANGALGRYVARILANAGFLVRGLGHGTWDSGEAARYGVSFWHSADVTLETLATYADEPEVIVHCAGSASVAFSVAHPYEDYLRTVTSTAAVLEYMRLSCRGAALVYPSSAAIYGIVKVLPIAESASMQPASPYGVHKQMAEELCRSYASSYGLNGAVVRLFSVYGEGFEKQLLWDACRKAKSGETVFFGTGAEVRDWLHVEDAARLMEAAIQVASPAIPTFNGGSGVGVTVREVAKEIYGQLVPDLEPCFSGIARPGDPPGYVADMSLVQSLPWNPRIDWRNGIRRYIDWFRAAHK